ncbi:hypothetical protein CC80DRAFT_525479 [Byssothecium circinans]|uniref:MFS general substrate transporter n=1 Tax=Byssothecium circinans TaxID=147558 RepID=A0A6A5TY80_9PLEO|nr:hypothetical protein CC80DRAFT_525479 [Byssothecium circinans]
MVSFSLLWRHPEVNPISNKARSIPFLNPFTDRYGRTFFFSWFGFMIAFWSWYAFPPLLADVIAGDIQMSSSQVANSNIIALAATLIVRLIAGPCCDHFGPRLTFAGCLLAGAIPTFLAGAVYNVSGRYALRFFIGILGGSFVPCQRVAFVVPGVLIVFVAMCLLLLCEDTPMGRWSDRGAMAEETVRSHSVTGVDVRGSITDTPILASEPPSSPSEKRSEEASILDPEKHSPSAAPSTLPPTSGDVIRNPTLGDTPRPVLHVYGHFTGVFLVVIGVLDSKDQGTMFGLVGAMALFLEGANGADFGLVPHVHPHANGVVNGVTGAAGNLGGIVFAVVFRCLGKEYGGAFWIIGVVTIAVNVGVGWIKPVR